MRVYLPAGTQVSHCVTRGSEVIPIRAIHPGFLQGRPQARIKGQRTGRNIAVPTEIEVEPGGFDAVQRLLRRGDVSLGLGDRCTGTEPLEQGPGTTQFKALDANLLQVDGLVHRADRVANTGCSGAG